MFNKKKEVVALLEGLIVELEQSNDVMDGYLLFDKTSNDVKEVFKEEIDRKAEGIDLFQE